jgi:hypothetical protein
LFTRSRRRDSATAFSTPAQAACFYYLCPVKTRWRGLPFRWDAETIAHGQNFTLTTTLGDLDVLGEVVGAGAYEQQLPHSTILTPFDTEHRCPGLDTLIHVKRAAGRPKDLEAIAELEALREERHEVPTRPEP